MDCLAEYSPPGGRSTCGLPGQGRCPESWGNAQCWQPSHWRHPPALPAHPRRPSSASNTLPQPTAAATPLYGTHSNCCKRGLQARSRAHRSRWCLRRKARSGHRPPAGLRFSALPHRPKVTEPGSFLVWGIKLRSQAFFSFYNISCLGNYYSSTQRRSEILGSGPRIGEAPAELCSPKCVGLPDKT